MASTDKPTTFEKEAPAKEAPATETLQGQEEALTLRMKRLDKAHNSIKNYTMGAMTVGLVPLPLIDLAALSAIQLKMVHSAANYYDVPFSKNIAKSIIGSLLGSSIAVTLAMPVASFIKLIPVLGQSSGTISTALIGSASTYAIGKIFVEHFESGGTFLDFDEEKAKEHFKGLYEEGRAFVASHKAATA
ncbi:MAG: DUF697 domain-containing protein [Methylobacter sp.]|jgi:uncharacterized protein (DUF697 family)|nr:DUF697 domain-containing protein [Methylobacter sp.]